MWCVQTSRVFKTPSSTHLPSEYPVFYSGIITESTTLPLTSKCLKRMISRKPGGKFLNTEQVMKSYARRRKRVNRHKMSVVIEEEEDDKCACTICLRSEPKPASRDLFAESKKLAELLNTLPQIGGPVPKQGKASRTKRIKRRCIPKPDVTVLHELGVCAECRVECELCIWDMKRTRRLAVLDNGDLAEDLDNLLISRALDKVWI